MTDDSLKRMENGSPKSKPTCEICEALSRFKDKERVVPCRRTCSVYIARDETPELTRGKSLEKIGEDRQLQVELNRNLFVDHAEGTNRSERKRVRSPRAANALRKRASSWSAPVICDCGKRWSSDGRLLRTESELSIDIEDMNTPHEDSHDEKLVAELTEAVPKINLSLQDETDHGLETAQVCKLCRSPNCLSVKPRVGFYTEEQIQSHVRPDDCWITAHGNVYDVTRYIGKHPGGSRSILNFGGRDTTRHHDFHTQFTKKKIWVRYKIGKVAYCDASERGENCCIS